MALPLWCYASERQGKSKTNGWMRTLRIAVHYSLIIKAEQNIIVRGDAVFVGDYKLNILNNSHATVPHP